MNTIRTSPYSRPLRAYVQSWREDRGAQTWKRKHKELKQRLWAFEDKLAYAISLFSAIHDSYWNWRRRVSDGVQAFDPEQAAAWRETWEWWLHPCDEVILKLTALEGDYGQVENGPQFRRHCEEARELLESWTEPRAKLHVSDDTHKAITRSDVVEGMRSQTQPAMDGSVVLKHEIDRSHIF